MTGPGRLIVGVLVVVAMTGCSRTFRASTVQPNPLAEPTETLRQSEKITIVTGDMDLEKPMDPEPTQRASLVRNEKYPLYNQASFTIVSRDRLRFHVQIDHKWQEWADLRTWDVYLEDDTGRRWVPESVEHARTKIMTTMWDREQRTAVRNRFGDVVAINEDGWRNRQTLGSLSVFRGKADFVFYQRDIFHAQVKRMRLVVKRSGEAFEFTWKFEDSIAASE
ncbi:MAG: hypothetical protein H0X17_08220 [Deltaproteobacteria bacterium]|nr:hypothetical protein [Deltaproteobacteria bacterium]